MSSGGQPTLWWVRRDFRLSDNPALGAAVAGGAAVLPLFVADPVLLRSAGLGRGSWLTAALQVLDEDLRALGGPGLSVVPGRPAEVVPRVAEQIGAGQVHIAADFGPYGRRRDAAVQTALAARGVELQATGSPYGVAPGTVTKADGSPFQVFSPYHRAWVERGVNNPAPALPGDHVAWLAAADRQRLAEADDDLIKQVGESAAVLRWQQWLDREAGGVSDYQKLRNFPGLDATSHLSVGLRWGHLHPRTVLADLSSRVSRSSAALAREVAWRDFFADVLYYHPEGVGQPIKPEFRALVSDDPATSPLARQRLEAWQQGRTGYPLVDAGMRQLRVDGWMHNRVRMLVASFVIKDLHLDWTHGARYFMERLRDGDVAQNQLNWQWVAGCGTDPAPYFRVFNPTGQAEKFDPDGTYIRRYVPELADVPLEYLHSPWKNPAGLPAGYPAPIVDHAEERKEALRRYEALPARQDHGR